MTGSTARASIARPGRLLGDRILLPDDTGRLRFETVLFKTSAEALTDMHVDGISAMPASGFLTIAFRAAGALDYGGAIAIEDLEIADPLLITRQGVAVQTVITPASPTSAAGQVFAEAGDGGWRRHATFRIVS